MPGLYPGTLAPPPAAFASPTGSPNERSTPALCNARSAALALPICSSRGVSAGGKCTPTTACTPSSTIPPPQAWLPMVVPVRVSFIRRHLRPQMHLSTMHPHPVRHPAGHRPNRTRRSLASTSAAPMPRPSASPHAATLTRRSHRSASSSPQTRATPSPTPLATWHPRPAWTPPRTTPTGAAREAEAARPSAVPEKTPSVPTPTRPHCSTDHPPLLRSADP